MPLKRLIPLTLALSVCLNANASSITDDVVSTKDSTLLLNEVTITAIKQGNDIQRQPISSTTLNIKSIEKNNIVSIKGASEIVPNLFIPEYGSRMTSSIYVRGIGARIDQPVVGLNVDNVPILNKDNYDFNLIDVNKIEVLRGSQSTLYGRNTMGGLINIYTLSPLKYQGLRILAEYGRGNTMQAALSYYTKIKPNLGIGFVGNYYSTDGFYKNMNDGEKCDWEHSGGGRIKLGWIHSKVKLENTFSFSVSRQGGYPYEYIKTGEINYNDTCFYKRASISDGLTLRFKIKDVDFSSVTSYQYIDDNMTLDQDFLPASYFTITQKRKENALTQDFIAKGLKDKYSWLGGVFGFYKNSKMNAPVTFLEEGISNLIEKNRNDVNPSYPIRWNDRVFPLYSDFTNASYGAALYHQSSLKLGKWDLSLGLRLDYEKSELDYHSHCNSSYTIYKAEGDGTFSTFENRDIVINDKGSLSKDFLQFLPKFSAVYNLPMESPSNLFASISKGYKAGGFNNQMFSDVLKQRIMGMMGLAGDYKIEDIISYKPEESWNFEVGAHIECYDSRIQTDISLFYIDVNNQQLTVFPDGTTTGRIMTNAGKSRSFGAELALKIVPIKNLEINTSYGYTNAKFTEYDNGKGDYSGNFVPYAPQNTLFAGVTYTLPVNKSWLRNIQFDVNTDRKSVV